MREWPVVRRPSRLAASAIAVAIVVARFLAAPGLPHTEQRRSAVATSTVPHHTPGRTLRAEQDPSRTHRSYGLGALIAPPVITLVTGPSPVAAPPFRDLPVPAAARTPAPGRARAPPLG